MTLAMRDKVGIPLQLWSFPCGWHQLGIAPYHQGEREGERRRESAMTGNGGRECGGGDDGVQIEGLPPPGVHDRVLLPV